MEIKIFPNYHLVKQNDLNHHGTLYAGRCADWFVESGFIAAANLAKPENIVCLKIHGLVFSKPAHAGDILCFESRVILVGKTSLMAHVRVIKSGVILLEGFITFIHVDLKGKPVPHGIKLEYTTGEEIHLMEEARQIKEESR
jgi:acyl-CoA hydrolase